MYFFGIFHKINTDFLNPESSCAMALWNLMPWPLHLINSETFHYTAIYGTFVAEGLIALALLVKPLRHYGIALGIAFHLLLSLSSYAMYISFTTLSIALHCLFLKETAARQILASPVVTFVQGRLAEPIYKIAMIAVGLLLAAFAFGGQYVFVTLVALPLVLPFCWAILRYGDAVDRSKGPLPIIGLIVGALFFLNCSMPYLGLKTAQSVNMFANLRLEAGVSNHLVFSAQQRPFRYLDDVVTMEESGRNFVYYDVLAWLRRNPEQSATFILHGKRYESATAKTLADDIDRILMPDWANKWFHFQEVDLNQPEMCDV